MNKYIHVHSVYYFSFQGGSRERHNANTLQTNIICHIYRKIKESTCSVSKQFKNRPIIVED